MGLGIIITVNGVPDAELAQASRVEVYERLGETTHFNIYYPEDISDGDLNRLKDNRLGPGAVISILADVNDTQECLVKGHVYSQQIHLEHGGEGSSVLVKGADTSITMDRVFQSVVWADVTDSDAVTSIFGNYGLVADVFTTNARHLEDKHSLVQRETDLRFIRRLARRNGCYCWITSDAAGVETAHFKQPQLEGEPVAELSINFQSPNIQSFDISWNTERPTSVEGLQLDLNTKNNLDGQLAQTPQSLLGSLSLQAITGDVRTMQVSAPADDAGNLQARSQGALIEADWFVQASCRTSLHQFGKLLHAHTIVNVKGAGSRHSGKYLVAAVRHIIDPSAHVMEVKLVRNGWEEAATGGIGGGIF
ncbi:hypothetical protein L3C95_33045 [Chitinophaga filiformis]|uniref:phage late control D family protein n=1 Tax=Chitinophaga filiformis TaxID=104663 RepID=UPI001F18FFA0|nr:hypothetical protein [Chitinophaga filiformis]MCF6407761.1 hypothetical protein [Chitinophaga filiformis]